MPSEDGVSEIEVTIPDQKPGEKDMAKQAGEVDATIDKEIGRAHV